MWLGFDSTFIFCECLLSLCLPLYGAVGGCSPFQTPYYINARQNPASSDVLLASAEWGSWPSLLISPALWSISRGRRAPRGLQGQPACRARLCRGSQPRLPLHKEASGRSAEELGLQPEQRVFCHPSSGGSIPAGAGCAAPGAGLLRRIPARAACGPGGQSPSSGGVTAGPALSSSPLG